MANHIYGKVLGSLHRVLGTTEWGTHLALKLRNQCDAVLRARLSDGRDPERNGEILLLSRIAPSAHYFIDVGANVGLWSKAFFYAMEARTGKGLLFEPSPEAVSRARANLSAYGERVEIVQAALGSEPGEGVFYAEAESGETSSLVRAFSQKGATPMRVSVTTLDHELEKRSVDYVDFVKVDAEGLDLQVLKGARKTLRSKKIGIVQFEYNFPWALTGCTLADAINFLEEVGYAVFLLKSSGLYHINYRRYGEYFGFSNYVGISEPNKAMVRGLIRGQI